MVILGGTSADQSWKGAVCGWYGTPHYKQAMALRGYGDEAERVQELYLAGHKDEATDTIPDEFIDEESLVGPVARIRERYQAWTNSGIDGLTICTADPAAIELIASLTNGG